MVREAGGEAGQEGGVRAGAPAAPPDDPEKMTTAQWMAWREKNKKVR